MRSVIISIMILLVVINTINASNFIIQPHPIKFDRVPLSQIVLAGTNVSFSCSAVIADEPTQQPQFIWYHNDTEITNANISSIGINTSTLFISDVSEMDQGEYHCIIKDWETRTKSEAGKLIVYGDGSNVKSQHLNVISNETVVLQCNTDGIEPALIQWLWNENATIDFMNKRFYKLQDGSLVILRINNNDTGEYSCGTALDREHVIKLKSYILTVSTNRSRAKEAVLLYPERHTHFFENMTIVCQIPSTLQVYNVTWIRNGTIIGSTTEDTEVVEYNVNLLRIRRMASVSNEYNCLVYKSNSDESPAISPSLTVYKYSMPVIEHSNVMDYYICVNSASTVNFLCVNGTVQTISLYCNSVGGFPVPTITWYHNGDEIFNATIVNGTLILNKSACDLLGTYQCVVSNEFGIETAVFRVLPYGWPSAPGAPKLSTKGRILFISWKKPLHLGGLNMSSINYAMWKSDYSGYSSLNENDCTDTQCNITVSYIDLKSTGTVGYFVNLNIKPMSTMCQGYNLPHNVKSNHSKIRLSEIIEYGPPLVNLTCSNEEAIVTTLPTGSLSTKELQNERFVTKRIIHWSCTNGTKNLNFPDHDKILWVNKFNFSWIIPWRSYNCSAKVTFTYNNNVNRKSILKNCSSTMELPTGVTPSSPVTTLNVTVSPAMSQITKELPSLAIPSSPVTTLNVTVSPTMSLITKELPSLAIPSPSVTLVSQTIMEPIIQATQSLLPTEDKSHLVGTDFAAVALSLVIALVFIAFFIIVTGFVIKWKRKRHIDSSERAIHGSLASIKAYSYIGREEQSVCEKATINWINNLNENDEIESIKSDNLSNEQMLNDLYGIKATKFQCNKETNKDVDITRGRSNSDWNQPMGHIDGDKTEESAHSAAVSSTLSTDYTSSDCSSSNRYSYNFASMERISDYVMNNLIPSYACTSAPSRCNIEVVDCQNQSLSSEVKSNVFILQYNTHGTDDTPVAQRTNEFLHKCTPEKQDPYPYVGLSFAPDVTNCSAADSDTKVILDNSSAGYIQEANLTIQST